MLDNLYFYYFSPTGGTRKVGEIFCRTVCDHISYIDLFASKNMDASSCDLAVIAMPVYGGRIPGVAAERLKAVNGAGKNAVTIAVYGNRAYEDALLELNDIVQQCGFHVAASSAMIAQHSVVQELAKGRPDLQDVDSITAFANKVMEKLKRSEETTVVVPGNTPYKAVSGMSVSPICSENCTLCGTCVSACPVNAVTMQEERIETDTVRCFLCMSCVSKCPGKARMLPASLQEKMDAMLAQFIPVRKENEYFL